MFSKYLCYLLLFTVVCCAKKNHIRHCTYYRFPSKEVECATKDVLLGWINVVNKPALRAEAVMQNVSQIVRLARGQQEKAYNAILDYQKFRESLDVAVNEKEIELINRAIQEANKSAAQTKECQLIAERAMEKANESKAASINYFDAVMRVAYFLWRVDPQGKWNYINVKTVLYRHGVGCEKEYNISKILDDNTGDIDSMNLTKWKNKTLDALQKTYDDMMINACRYHPNVRDDEKIELVKDAVAKSVERLKAAEHDFEWSLAAVEKAVTKLKNASRMVEETNNSLLASDIGKTFCEVVGQLRKHNERLGPVDKNVNYEKQKAVVAEDNSNQVHNDAKAADKLVTDVVAWFQRNYLPPILMLSVTDSSIATRSIAEASEAASKSVRDASQASKTASTIEKEVKAQFDSLKHVQVQLANMSAAAGNKISSATFEACNDGVSQILKSKSSDAIRHIAKFNMSLLSKLNVTLQEIGSTTDVIERNLSGVNKQVREAQSSAREASLLAKQATENVKQTIVKVLSGVVAKLCAALSELRALHDKSEAFSARAANASANISEWLVRIDTTAKESDALVDLSTSVEDAFATAEKRLEVVKRVLHRADEQRGKVAGELAASAVVAERNSNGASQVNKTLWDVLANITSRVSATFSKDVCNASLMSESLKLLGNMTDHTAVMSSLHVVAQLNRLADSMEGQVLKAHKLMRVAGASSAQVDAALEEAIRMARERSGKPQCPALYRQLLGALGLHW